MADTTPTIDPLSDPNVEQIAATTSGLADRLVTEPPVVDEFDGLDAAIAANARQDAIIAEQETVSLESLAADQDIFEQMVAAQPAEIAPEDDPEAALIERIEQEAIDEAIQAQQDADQDYATSAGYNSIEELRDAQDQQALDQIAGVDFPGPTGITKDKAKTAAAATRQNTALPPGDWRVRLSLAPGSNYLYKATNAEGILLPLKYTDGVIFPYTPNIQVSYAAHYDPTELTHSNYKIFQYKNSSVDNITITCDFTAQDTAEANYLLAVIHFFKSVTKMFYGKDKNPMRGTPPPLCYLTGLGQFQFDQHPLAITGFNYILPTDVDYIRANITGTTVPGGNTGVGGSGTGTLQEIRSAAAGVFPGGGPGPPNFNFNAATNTQATYVPTKMQLSITAVPIVSRGDISKEFSLTKYATGALLQGSSRPGGGGIW
jgi:hypothetical protein